MTQLTPIRRIMLDRVADANLRGHYPPKLWIVGYQYGPPADSCRHLPARTRSYRYRIVDALINDRLLTDVSGSGNRYALQITDLGKEALTHA